MRASNDTASTTCASRRGPPRKIGPIPCPADSAAPSGAMSPTPSTPVERTAQRVLADSQRRVPGDAHGQRRDRQRQQRQLGQQLHGGLPSSGGAGTGSGGGGASGAR